MTSEWRCRRRGAIAGPFISVKMPPSSFTSGVLTISLAVEQARNGNGVTEREGK